MAKKRRSGRARDEVPATYCTPLVYRAGYDLKYCGAASEEDVGTPFTITAYTTGGQKAGYIKIGASSEPKSKTRKSGPDRDWVYTVSNSKVMDEFQRRNQKGKGKDLEELRLGTALYEAAAQVVCDRGSGHKLRSGFLRSEFSESFWRKQHSKGRARCAMRNTEGYNNYYDIPWSRLDVKQKQKYLDAGIVRPQWDDLRPAEGAWPCQRWQMNRKICGTRWGGTFNNEGKVINLTGPRKRRRRR